MSTEEGQAGESALFGKTRSAVLSLLLLRPDERFHLRQIARLTGSGLGAVQRELAAMAQAGIVVREAEGRQVYFRANRQSAIFHELQQILIKTSGVRGVLREALAPIAHGIRVAFIFGSVARGEQNLGSDVDVLVIADPGGLSFGQLADALRAAQSKLGRDVNPSFYPPDEFRKKWSAGHHFVREVVSGTKVFLIGGEDELRAVAGERPHQTSRRVAR